MAADEKLLGLIAQAESGNRDLDANGQVLTSPKGAKGRMQVMDATNRDPGFGVRPAQDDSLEERTRVGKDYFGAMLTKHGGDVQKALASYNAGPGRVDKAIAEGGDDWLSRLPEETRNYTSKIVADMAPQQGVMDRVAASVLSSAQAAQDATPPAAPKKAKAWKDVIAGEKYQALTPDQQAAAQNQYFDQVVKPRVPGGEVEAARAQFLQRYPLATSQRTAGAGTTEMRDASGVLRVGMAQEGPSAPAEGEGGSLTGMLRGVDDPKEWARQAGLTARAATSGISAIPETLVNAIVDSVNRSLGTTIPRAEIKNTLDAIGLPKPGTSVERVAQDVAGALAGTGGTVALGRALTGAAAPVAQGAGEALSSHVGGQAIAATAGTAAAGTTREAGGTEEAQLAAGLAGSLGPSLASAGIKGGARSLFRRGEEGRKRVEDTIASFRAAGSTPTVGQATQGRAAQAIESALAKAPGGAGVMNKKAVRQADEIAQQVDRIADRLAPPVGVSGAGEAVLNGLKKFKSDMRSHQNRLYSNLDAYLPKDALVDVGRTRAALAALNADIKDAPALSKLFKNGRIQGMERALLSDLGEEAQALPYESIKKLRTLVGAEIDNSNFTSDVPKSKWRALYGALAEDLGDAARKAGPEAEDAWRWANSYTRTQTKRMEELSRIAEQTTPERVFSNALLGSQDGDTQVKRLVSALPKDSRKQFASAVLRRMGKSLPGQQNDAGDSFSTERFLTNWSRMSPEARQTIFGRTGDQSILDDLAAIAKVSSNIRDGSRVFANPSGTSGAMATQMLGGGAVAAALMGSPSAAVQVAAVPAGMNMAARLMTHPKVVEMIARRTQINPAAAPAALQSAAEADRQN